LMPSGQSATPRAQCKCEPPPAGITARLLRTIRPHP
jgi:hypothetical protein